ncbi:hypothetical protein [Thermococcus sp. JdF3]|uniref:hypothetical protein n=1 Tax=Thermococcus sp. JdF3 TaxID=1638258 RepID=UPI00143C7A89|nr:hypothetical protein [Thermococcus sp. JdF3]NJE01288.1 hypothetical protein [Thermococcus sp. JdF3]
MGVDYYLVSIFREISTKSIIENVGRKFLSIKFGNPHKVKSILAEEGTTIEYELEFLKLREKELQQELRWRPDFEIKGVDTIIGAPLGEHTWIDATYLTVGSFTIAEFSSRVFHRVPDSRLKEFIHGLIDIGAEFICGWNDGQVFMEVPGSRWELYGKILTDLEDGKVGGLYSRLMVVDRRLLPLRDGSYIHGGLKERLLVVTEGTAKLVYISPTSDPSYHDLFHALPDTCRFSDFLSRD